MAKTDAANTDRLKARLQYAFESNGWTKLETPRFKVWLQNNGRAPVIYDTDDADQVPEQWRRVSVSIDKAKVNLALKAGEPVPFAHFGEKGQHLRFK